MDVSAAVTVAVGGAVFNEQAVSAVRPPPRVSHQCSKRRGKCVEDEIVEGCEHNTWQDGRKIEIAGHSNRRTSRSRD